MSIAVAFASYGTASFAFGPSSQISQVRGGAPIMASTLAESRKTAAAVPRLPLKRVTYIGAPFCEGQNLVGTDLAPTAMRQAGLQHAAEGLGWEWDDDGDLEFAAHFAERGIVTDDQHLASMQRYQAWVKSGMKDNFSVWCHENETADEKAARIARALTRPDESSQHGDKPDEVVNCELIGTGLELVYRKCAQSAQGGAFTLTVGGDHSVGAASIAGVASAYPDVGVIWIDAHADANTPATSPSMHYHGMPAAHLMGWFDRATPLPGFDWFPEGGCIDEGRLAYIGLRDIDEEESAAHSTRASVIEGLLNDRAKAGTTTMLCSQKDAFDNSTEALEFFVQSCETSYQYTRALCEELAAPMFEKFKDAPTAPWAPDDEFCQAVVDLVTADGHHRKELDKPPVNAAPPPRRRDVHLASALELSLGDKCAG